MIDNDKYIPARFLRESLPIPNTAEPDAVRHFTNLSRKNHSIDLGFYPLGSCTMKYNPKINEDIARIEGFANTHPLTDEKYVQGNLRVMYELSEMLCEITGMDAFTLQPAAGAHGELTGLMTIRAYHESIGQGERDTIIIPDSAHGTNPASAVMAGYKVLEIKSDDSGNVDIGELKKSVNNRTAGLMLTNPNTLGLFEVNITEIAETIHEAGGLLYYDGANLNAIMGITRPGDMGFDVIHLNLHKTFSTPHGGGGPGSGPVGVKPFLEKFLPVPSVVKCGGNYRLDYDKPYSVGKVRSFYGNFGVYLKAYAYILSMGADGLKYASEAAVINANYLMHKLKAALDVPYNRICMHEFVASGECLKKYGITTMDVAKRVTDFGVHPPTVYFPLIVKDAMMFEPTETESKESLDAFAEIVAEIIAEAETDPAILKNAPHNAPVGRLDEVKAARQLILKAEV